MTAVFADTSWWVALTNKLDTPHQQALALSSPLGAARIVTTEQGIVEYLNFFAEWGEHFRRHAAANVRGALTLSSVTIVPHTHENFLAGLTLYEARLDKKTRDGRDRPYRALRISLPRKPEPLLFKMLIERERHARAPLPHRGKTDAIHNTEFPASRRQQRRHRQRMNRFIRPNHVHHRQ